MANFSNLGGNHAHGNHAHGCHQHFKMYINYAELSDIDFSTPHAKRKKVDSSETSKSCYSGSSKVIDTPTEEELDTFLKDLSTAGKAVILSITPKFSDSFVPTVGAKKKFT